jgi:deoxyribodipyrimidine photo-lyase
LVWFRGDLRLGDNPALAAAAARGGPVVPVYVLDDGAEGRWRPGAASRWWLHHSLGALDGSLRERGSRLVLARGGAGRELTRLSRACGAGAVYWNRRYEPAVLQRDRIVVADLAKEGLEARDFNSTLLFEPWSVANREGGPFQVFTPYWRRCLEIEVEAPRAPPRGVLARPAQWPASLALEELALLPAVRWYDGIAKAWQPGEKAAAARLRRFVPGALGSYAADRDRPDIAGTSMLSPCLHFGEVGPRQVWHALKAPSRESGVFPQSESARAFLRELGWREFAYHLLHHFPLTPERAHRQVFRGFPWARDPGGRKLSAWRKGLTGYPIVDAGMRQLWQTGWMHNRVRMIASSFLVKHLRVPWTEGARWFWNTLVDADLANNTLGWQWIAGCGADAAPYFRIFAPVVQAERLDPLGAYVRQWVPELAGMPVRFIQRPWEAPEPVLRAAGVRLGATYPRPIVDHAAAREGALAAFRSMRNRRVA